MRPILAYESYRDFLKDAYAEEKQTSKRVTIAEYAKKLDLSSSALNMILTGSRNLTIANLHQIARAMKLSKTDREYFETLVLREQAHDAETRSYYSSRLNKIKKTAKVKSLRISDKRVLNNWIAPAFLVYLVDVEKIKNREQLERLNVAELGSKFGLTRAQIEALLQAFLDTGLIEIDPKDRIHIVFDKVTHHLPQRDYLKAVLSEFAQKVDSDFESKESIFRSFIFTMEKKHIPDLRSELIHLFEKYMTKHSSNPDENALIQSFVGAFPVF